MSESYPRPRTVVYVEEVGDRYRVRVRYAGADPSPLLSAPTLEEAETFARGMAAKYGWLLDRGEAES